MMTAWTVSARCLVDVAPIVLVGARGPLERTARWLKPEGPGELPGEALHEWAAKLEGRVN